jgi:cardiolipin synthase
MVTRTDIKGRHQDIQYLIEGPAAPLIEAVHREDWAYITGAPAEKSRSNGARAGEDYIRVIRSMPNDDFESFKKIVLSAIGLTAPGEKVRLQTAYFAPDREFIRALELACQRGVVVQLILSKENTVPPVDWASRQFFSDLLDAGVELYYQPPPFDHTKLVTIGDYYTIGSSANFDHRSQTFHNEASIEIYSKRVNAIVAARFDRITANSQNRVTREWVKSWPWYERLRNAISQLPSYVY